MFFGCNKEQPQEYVIPKMESEFIDTKSDSQFFEVHSSQNIFQIDSEVWIKDYDIANNANHRTIMYKIFRNGLFPGDSIVHYVLKPSSVMVSSRPNLDYLNLYKNVRYLDTSIEYLYERSGIYTRYIFQDFLQVKSGDFYNGPALHSALHYETVIDDSSLVKTIVDEYYGLNRGLVKVYRQEITFVNGKRKNKSSWTKFRVR